MKSLSLLLFFLPLAGIAQLDRLKAGMTEQEFIKAVPEAKRDLESESGYIGDTGSVGGLSGDISWRIYNDTIQGFTFASNVVYGPSEQFPKVDSAEVHKLKEVAEKLRFELELINGKPQTVYNECLNCATMMDNPFVYFAKWVLPGKGSIAVGVSIRQEFGEQINPSYKPIRKSESYYLFMHVFAATPMLRVKYDVGRSAEEFLLKYPEYEPQAKFTHNHVYTFEDTATSKTAIWQFIFIDKVFTYAEYNAWFGSNYGDNDVAAFDVAKKRAARLLQEGKKAHGRPKSSSNKVPDKYVVHTDYYQYNNDYMNAEWKMKEGIASMKFVEFGGGKHVGTSFHIQYIFERAE